VQVPVNGDKDAAPQLPNHEEFKIWSNDFSY